MWGADGLVPDITTRKLCTGFGFPSIENTTTCRDMLKAWLGGGTSCRLALKQLEFGRRTYHITLQALLLLRLLEESEQMDIGR